MTTLALQPCANLHESLPEALKQLVGLQFVSRQHTKQSAAGSLGRMLGIMSNVVPALIRSGKTWRQDALTANGQPLDIEIKTRKGREDFSNLRGLNLYISGDQKTPEGAHEELGKQLSGFRSAIQRKAKGLLPWPETSSMKALLRGTVGTIPRIPRAAFGLPLQYHFRALGTVTVEGDRHPRRASPLLLRVLPVKDGFVQLLVYLKAPLLEATEKLVVKSGVQKEQSETPDDAAIQEFIAFAMGTNR